MSAPPPTAPAPKTVPEALARAEAVAICCAANAAAVDFEGAFPTDEFRWLAEAGLLGVALGQELGGLGLGVSPGTTADLLRLLTHIGRGSLPVGRLYEGHVNALLLMQMFGTPEQQRGWAGDVREHGRLFSVWNTEAEDGLRVIPLDSGHFRLEGAKTFASGAGHVARPLVTGALPDGGWQMCIVPTERVRPAVSDPSFWQPLGMRATASVRLDFTGIEVEREDLLGAPGDYYRQPVFSGGGVRFCAVQIGGAQAILEATRACLRGMGRTDDPYQRARVGQMATLAEAGRLWLRGAGECCDRPGGDAAQVVEYAHMTRAAVEEICLEVMRLAERSVGARGLLRPFPFERLHRDLTLYLRQAGADAALAHVGRHVLESEDPIHDLWPLAGRRLPRRS